MRFRRAGAAEATTPLERVAIGVASLALSIGLIAVMSGFFASRDPAGVSGAQNGPGQPTVNQGDAHLRAGELRPVYASDPPTSGAHVPKPVGGDNAELSDDQILTALEHGDVVLAYGGSTPPPALSAFARSVAPAFTPALAAAGQAVIIARRPDVAGVVGVAWRRIIRVNSASDPQLRDFVQFWLGKGVQGS